MPKAATLLVGDLSAAVVPPAAATPPRGMTAVPVLAPRAARMAEGERRADSKFQVTLDPQRVKAIKKAALDSPYRTLSDFIWACYEAYDKG